MDSKKRLQKYSKISLILISILIISAPILIFLSSFDAIVFDPNYYHEKFIELDVYDDPMFEDVPLMQETTGLIGYLRYGKDQIDTDFFNQREKDHLEDVKDLFRQAISLRRFFFFMSIILLIFLYRLEPTEGRFTKAIAKYLMFGGLLTMGVVAIAWIGSSNFAPAFDNVHNLLFEEGTWIFNEQTDHLVNMFPEQFFFDISRSIMSLALIIASIGVGVGLLLFYRPLLSSYCKKFITRKD